ncbi:MAG: hypothetical protein FWC61_03980 [Proteobacteria bacterium]|nr:hypothetical protein [Pseudomonadota bacterium]
MRKLFSIFAAVVIACACPRAHADDSETEVARAGRPGVAAPISAAPAQSAATAAQQRGPAPASNRATPAGAVVAPTAPSARGAATREPTPEATRTAAPGQSQISPGAGPAPNVRAAATPREVAARAAPESARTAVARPSVAGNQLPNAPVRNQDEGWLAAHGPGERWSQISRAGIAPQIDTNRQSPAASRQSPIARSVMRAAAAPGIAPKSVRAAITQITGGDGNLNDYQLCRDTYFQCMDEFCANKDSQLRRCACSKRMHDFDKAQKNMDKFQNKMLDFNQRLLTVSMDKEDATASIKATEGETAFQAGDTSPSQQILDTIMGKLKSTNADNKDTHSLAMITLSLDTSTVFDTIDYTLGATTATKEGDALFRAALPVCKEIAAEICAPDDISIAQSAYEMAIEQDCNTAQKAYESLQDSALQKVREGNALLDMSRLQNYQDRNADDTLTCKKKMLDMLANDAVCGADLGKCLDWSGKYIDPSTGTAILTSNLSNLANMLVPPNNDPAGANKWVKVKENSGFVKFLNAKKKYISPAMDSCEKISDMVWNGFMEDALAQIKIAQTRKLEDMRQSCTTITTTCLAGMAQSLTDFDTRALSVFGVNADRTVNQMCAQVRTACDGLMAATGGAGGTDWQTGMTEIARDKTFDQIIKTCIQVGQNCIVQNCTSAAGNFGLCNFIQDYPTSINRNKVLTGTICFNDVVSCVNDANLADDVLNAMRGAWYGAAAFATPGGSNLCTAGVANMNTCLLAQYIWGGCNSAPQNAGAEILVNAIITDSTRAKYSTIMAWFGTNTHKDCYAANCPKDWGGSVTGCDPSYSGPPSPVTECPANKKFAVASGLTNCCDSGAFDSFGNCCPSGGVKYVPVDVTDTGAADFFRVPGTSPNYNANTLSSGSKGSGWGFGANQTAYSIVCSGPSLQFIAKFTSSGGNSPIYLFCSSSGGTGKMSGTYATGGNATCSGRFLAINAARGTYSAPVYTPNTPNGPVSPAMYYTSASGPCTYSFNPDTEDGTWSGSNCTALPNALNETGGSWNGAIRKDTPPNMFINF